MLKVMLCGAADTAELAIPFSEVTSEFGGEAWQYQTGQILYRNHATSSWENNSQQSVRTADICVFVILRDYGEITWSTELVSALDSGVPFLILCFSQTYAEYRSLIKAVPLNTINDENKRNLIEVMKEIESERQLTVVTFDLHDFSHILRRELSKLFEEALCALTQSVQRRVLSRILDVPEKMTHRELAAAEELALDEFEDKRWRKAAICALMARGGASLETTHSLLKSQEQGVQRFAFSQLSRLYTVRPVETSFVEDCIEIANNSDDPGIVRRLIPSLFDLGVPEIIHALELLDLTEIGARRRLAEALEKHEKTLREHDLIGPTISLLVKCLTKSEDSGWLSRCRMYLDRLKDEQCN